MRTQKIPMSLLAVLAGLLTLPLTATLIVDGAYLSVTATGSAQSPNADFAALNTATGFPLISSGDLAESGTFTASHGLVLGVANDLRSGNASQVAIFNNESLNNTTVKTFFLDLGTIEEIAQILTFAHNRAPNDISTSRANQHYTLYAATGNEVGFNATDLGTYTNLRTVNTLNAAGIDNDLGGIGTGLSNNDYGYTGIRIGDSTGKIGDFRYLAFATNPVAQTGNALYTSFYEIDVIAVPEPGTLALVLLSGVTVLLGLRRRVG